MIIKNTKQIATRLGDTGNSKNYNNEMFKKNDILFEVLGAVDELSSFLGLAYHFTGYEQLKSIQKILENINSAIATSPKSELFSKIRHVNVSDVNWLEEAMQSMLETKPLEAKFSLPGSEKSKSGAFFDYARTLARKAERRLVDFMQKKQRSDLNLELKYLNRLSDFLFVLANHL